VTHRGRPAETPRRIVSLVPSLTEALFELGLGERVVGVTEWCVHPAGAVAALPKVGGTKTPDLAAIEALAPDLVIANHEENRRRDVTRLEALGIHVCDLPRRPRYGLPRCAWRSERPPGRGGARARRGGRGEEHAAGAGPR
jgi:ABC-type hemin transport system substrate-binding protein